MKPTTPLQRAHSPVAQARQQGAALIVALIMLLLLLMLAVTGMRTITLEARIAANLVQHQQLFETADGTLREGERAITGKFQGRNLEQCAADSTAIVTDQGVPCYVSDVRSDQHLDTDFTRSDKAAGFEKPNGFWYPRYIEREYQCGDSMGLLDALKRAGPGCNEYYEVNAQATQEGGRQACGENALCLRSTVNQFIQ